MQLAGAQGVLQAEIDRVQPQLAGNLLHMPVHRPVTLRHAITAIGACRWMVGINDIGIEADIGALPESAIPNVQRHRFMTGIAGDGQRMAAISAGIGQHPHRIGGHRAILLDAGLHMDVHRDAGSGPQ